MLDGDKKIS